MCKVAEFIIAVYFILELYSRTVLDYVIDQACNMRPDKIPMFMFRLSCNSFTLKLIVIFYVR